MFFCVFCFERLLKRNDLILRLVLAKDLIDNDTNDTNQSIEIMLFYALHSYDQFIDITFVIHCYHIRDFFILHTSLIM